MLLERIEVVGGHRRRYGDSAEEGERAHDAGVDRLLPHDGPAGLDLAVQAGRESVGVLAGVGPDDEVLPLADRAIALGLELLLELDRLVARAAGQRAPPTVRSPSPRPLPPRCRPPARCPSAPRRRASARRRSWSRRSRGARARRGSRRGPGRPVTPSRRRRTGSRRRRRSRHALPGAPARGRCRAGSDRPGGAS